MPCPGPGPASPPRSTPGPSGGRAFAGTRAEDSKLIQREGVRVEEGIALRTEIRAFPGTQALQETQAPAALPPETSDPVAAPKGEITREEMEAAIAKASSQAKTEALAPKSKSSWSRSSRERRRKG